MTATCSVRLLEPSVHLGYDPYSESRLGIRIIAAVSISSSGKRRSVQSKFGKKWKQTCRAYPVNLHTMYRKKFLTESLSTLPKISMLLLVAALSAMQRLSRMTLVVSKGFCSFLFDLSQGPHVSVSYSNFCFLEYSTIYSALRCIVSH